MKLPKDTLSASRQMIFDDYQSQFGQQGNVFDLTQYPLRRPRALLKDNSLPTITKGCRFFGSHVHRFLHGVEALVGQGWPLHPAMNGFNAAKRDHFLSLAPTLSTSFAGNGMHIGCIGLVLSWILGHGQVQPTDRLSTSRSATGMSPASPTCQDVHHGHSELSTSRSTTGTSPASPTSQHVHRGRVEPSTSRSAIGTSPESPTYQNVDSAACFRGLTGVTERGLHTPPRRRLRSHI